MLGHVLDRDRMFCVGNALPGVDAKGHSDPVRRYTTAGLVRACVTHPNGTSHLMLSGLQRVEIVGWEQDEPFRVARVVPRPSHVEDIEAVATVARTVVDLCGRLSGADQPISSDLREHLKGVRDPAAISDVVAQNFVSDSLDRQSLIETLDVLERLNYLSQHLSMRLAKEQG